MRSLFVQGTRRSALAVVLLVASLLPSGAGGVAATSQVSDVPGAQVLDVATGSIHTCAVRADATVGCWGENHFGQATPPDDTFIGVDAGDDTTCGIRSNGSLACWGVTFETDGNLPGGTFKDVSVGAVPRVRHSEPMAPSTAGATTRRVSRHLPMEPLWRSAPVPGTAVGSGPMASSSAGAGWRRKSPRPCRRTTPSTELDGTCAIRADGTLTCWSYPGEWTSPLAGTFLAVGGNCAIRTDRFTRVLGRRRRHRDYQSARRYLPCGQREQSHACAIRLDETLACWGDDYLGQRTPRPTPSVAAEAWRTEASASVSWAARHALVPVASFDVRMRRARWDGTFGAWTTLLTGVTTTSATFSTAPGYTYCYAVRARDLDGVVSRWTSQAYDTNSYGCSATPVDDRTLARSKGWHAGTGSAFYRGTRLRSTIEGAELSLPVRAQWIVLVATTCPTCGTVHVSLEQGDGPGHDRQPDVADAPATSGSSPCGTTAATGSMSGTVTIQVVTSGDR